MVQIIIIYRPYCNKTVPLDDNQLPVETQTLLCTTFPAYNAKQVIQIAATNHSIDDQPDEIQQQYRLIVDLCRRLASAFQCICRSLADHIIQTDYTDTKLQSCLARLLQDIRKDMKPTDFRNLYSNDLRPYVCMLDDPTVASSDDETTKLLLEKMILTVKRISEVNFSIIITHFPKFLYLKSRWICIFAKWLKYFYFL